MGTMPSTDNKLSNVHQAEKNLSPADYILKTGFVSAIEGITWRPSSRDDVISRSQGVFYFRAVVACMADVVDIARRCCDSLTRRSYVFVLHISTVTSVVMAALIQRYVVNSWVVWCRLTVSNGVRCQQRSMTAIFCDLVRVARLTPRFCNVVILRHMHSILT